MSRARVRRALISVSDKTGLVDFATGLRSAGVEIISTGGTMRALADAGIPARSVSEITGFPEILDGRVKTLHPKIHGGILAAADNPSHTLQIEQLGIEPIDLVAVNLYPFERTAAQGSVSLDDAIEQIDVGGPALLRAAAKNFRSKTVVVNPARYPEILAELSAHEGSVSDELRFSLAAEVFAHTAHYDAVIGNYLGAAGKGGDVLGEQCTIALPRWRSLRYGENPHQRAALYGSFGEYFLQLHGKELSFNNIVDIQAAAALVEEFSEPTAAVIKHANPCGVGSGPDIASAYRLAHSTDPKSAFGGIVCLNRAPGPDAAGLIDGIFTEAVIAPDYPAEVLEQFRRKKDRRVMRQLRPAGRGSAVETKSVAGGLLMQTPDDLLLSGSGTRVVTKRPPTREEERGLLFAWKVAKHVRSNAIVYARGEQTLGIGAGQMSRFDASRLAVLKAGEAGLDLAGSCVASDAFFPFADGLLEAVSAGATAVIQPGGSVRDNEVIAAADEHGIAMLFTGIRHFKH